MIITFYCSDDEGEGRLVIDEEEEGEEIVGEILGEIVLGIFNQV